MRVPEYASRMAELAARREAFAVATVTRTEGSTLAKTGFKVVIAGDGRIVAGTLGGGCPEGPIAEVALRALQDGSPRLVRVHLLDAAKAVEGMVRDPSEDEIYVETYCGGTLEVFVDPMLPPERLVLVGQGGKDDVLDALIRQAKVVGFEVVLVDPVPVVKEKPDILVEEDVADPRSLGLTERDSVVVLTKGERDVKVLEALAKAQLRYVGLLASRQRLRKDLAELRADGVPTEFLQALRAPVGLDIGAKTPGEIALSIMAEVVAAKYGKTLPRKPVQD